MHRKFLTKNCSVLLPDGLRVADIEASGQAISSIDSNISAGDPSSIIDAAGKYILPEFIEIHTNGIGGFDLTKGVHEPERDGFFSGEEVYVQGLDTAIRKYPSTGVSRVVLTQVRQFSIENRDSVRSRGKAGKSRHYNW